MTLKYTAQAVIAKAGTDGYIQSSDGHEFMAFPKGALTCFLFAQIDPKIAHTNLEGNRNGGQNNV